MNGVRPCTLPPPLGAICEQDILTWLALIDASPLPVKAEDEDAHNEDEWSTPISQPVPVKAEDEWSTPISQPVPVKAEDEWSTPISQPVEDSSPGYPDHRRRSPNYTPTSSAESVKLRMRENAPVAALTSFKALGSAVQTNAPVAALTSAATLTPTQRAMVTTPSVEAATLAPARRVKVTKQREINHRPPVITQALWGWMKSLDTIYPTREQKMQVAAVLGIPFGKVTHYCNNCRKRHIKIDNRMRL
jgi:hypothetical protein